MSRVGKHEIIFPAGLTMTESGAVLTFKGKLGSDSYAIPECIRFTKTDKGVRFDPSNDAALTRSLWGTTQRNVGNIIKGLDQGFIRKVELVGVGYRANVVGSNLVLQLGFSHDIEYPIPTGITIKCEKTTSIAITGSSKQQVGEVAAYLGTLRPPEPYKGKGVIRENIFVARKEGKKK